MNTAAQPTALPLKHSTSIVAQVLWVVGFTIATALSARLEVPHAPVPYTLQTMFVLLAGAFLGARNGAISQCLYLGAGALGMPVFAGGAFGFAQLLGPTGGYLFAFPVGAAIVGFLVQNRHSMVWTFLSMAAGLLFIFVAGTLQLYAVLLHNVGQAVSAGLLIFSWWDGLKLTAATMIYHELAKRWPRLP